MAYVLYRAGLFSASGQRELYGLITSIDRVYFALSLAASVVLNLSSSIKWHMLLRSRAIPVKLGQLLGYYYIGKFFNLFLPTSIGGDVVRIYKLAKTTGKTDEAVASVFVERFTGMITLTFFSIFAFIVSYKIYNVPEITISLLLCSIIIIVIGWVILDRRPLRLISRIASKKFHLLGGLLIKANEIHNAVISYKDNRRALWVAFLNSAIFYFLAVINVWVSALAFSPTIQFASIVVAVPAIMLLMNLPISVGGIGLMEFAYTIVFELFGYGAAIGLSIALLMRFKTILDGVAGGMLYVASKEKRYQV